MLLQPLRIQLPPQSPAPRASAPRWPASGQGPGHRRWRGEPFQRPLKSAQLGPGDACSAPTASPGVAEPPGHLGTGPCVFLGLCSQHLPCPLTSYGTGTAPLLPNGISWASVHLPADSRLLQSRTRLLPSEAEPSPAARSSELGARGRKAPESSTPGSASMMQEPRTSPPPRPSHRCSRDSARCRTVRGSFPTEQAHGQHCTCQPGAGTPAAAQGLCRLFGGRPRAPGAGNLPPARTCRTRQPFPAQSRPPGPGQDQVSPSNSSRPAPSAALIGRAPGGSGVVTSGPRRQQRKPSGGHLESVRL